VLHNLDPFLQITGEYVPEVQAFFANLTSATQASLGNGDIEAVKNQRAPKLHYLTTMSVLSPESLSVYPSKVETSRINAYPLPGTYRQLASTLPVFEAVKCFGPAPSVSGPPNDSTGITEEIIEQIQGFKVANKPETENDVAAPGCRQQGPYNFNGQSSQFPHGVYSGK
jgi:hypothetical protein